MPAIPPVARSNGCFTQGRATISLSPALFETYALSRSVISDRVDREWFADCFDTAQSRLAGAILLAGEILRFGQKHTLPAYEQTSQQP
jgi:hypothetical protein